MKFPGPTPVTADHVQFPQDPRAGGYGEEGLPGWLWFTMDGKRGFLAQSSLPPL